MWWSFHRAFKMFNYIEKLRKKSERTKKLVALGVAFFCAAVIFAFWIFSVMPNFAQEQEITARVQSVEPSPLSAFATIISQGTSGISGALSKLKTTGTDFLFSAIKTAGDTATSSSAVLSGSATSSEIATTSAQISTTTKIINGVKK